jgi:hypothetical protein
MLFCAGSQSVTANKGPIAVQVAHNNSAKVVIVPRPGGSRVVVRCHRQQALEDALALPARVRLYSQIRLARGGAQPRHKSHPFTPATGGAPC